MAQRADSHHLCDFPEKCLILRWARTKFSSRLPRLPAAGHSFFQDEGHHPLLRGDRRRNYAVSIGFPYVQRNFDADGRYPLDRDFCIKENLQVAPKGYFAPQH